MIVILLVVGGVLIAAALLFRPRPMTAERAEHLARDWYRRNVPRGPTMERIAAEVYPWKWEGYYRVDMWTATQNGASVLVTDKGHIEEF